jgi:hypothetical protein
MQSGEMQRPEEGRYHNSKELSGFKSFWQIQKHLVLSG